MAQIVPSDITHLALAGATNPELETLCALQAKLPPAYTIFHGIHWSREYASAIVFGEVDFVIVNQAGSVLVVEQKNGPLDETEAGLVKRYPGHTRLVGDQLRRSLEGIREKFKWMHGPRPGLDLDYLIYCPDHRVVRLNAAALDPSRIVDASSRQTLAGRIGQILGPGPRGSDEWVDKVLAFFSTDLRGGPGHPRPCQRPRKGLHAPGRPLGPASLRVGDVPAAPSDSWNGWVRKEPHRPTVLPHGACPGQATLVRLL